MKCKAFDAFLRELNQNPMKAKKYLEDKRPTEVEKKIIKGYLLLRDNRCSEIIGLIAPLPASSIPFVEAHKNLLLGMSYNTLTQFDAAADSLRRAITGFDSASLSYYQFIARYNLFITLSNVGALEAMEKLVTEMAALGVDSDLKMNRLLRCHFILADDRNETALAERLLLEIAPYKSKMTENDITSQLICEYMFYSKQGRFEDALDTLNEMKKFRKYSQSENFNFMKKLLEHYLHETPIYAYEKDFKESPRLYHEIMLIHALESREMATALKHWRILQDLEPQNFKAPFQYLGTPSIFTMCLKKHVQKIEAAPKPVPEEGQKKSDLLIKVLKETKAPVQKAFLFELIWGHPPESKDDMVRLSRLVAYVRAREKVEIQTRKGTYFIVGPFTEKEKAS